MARDLDLEVPRNGHYAKTWQLLTTDDDGNEIPVDLTDHTLDMDARAVAGAGSVIASATLAVLDAEEGKIGVVWDGSDFDAIGVATEVVRVAYDLKDTYPDSVIDIVARGQLVIYPECTA